MSEQINSPAPRYVTCRCQHCDGHIEFDANQLTDENSVFSCPHCGLETKLFAPQIATVPAGPDAPAAGREGCFCGDPDLEVEAPLPASASGVPSRIFSEPKTDATQKADVQVSAQFHARETQRAITQNFKSPRVKDKPEGFFATLEQNFPELLKRRIDFEQLQILREIYANE